MSSSFILARSSGLAAAYDGNAAANYADHYWSNYNPNIPNYCANGGNGDCANYASQALQAGGFSYRGYPSDDGLHDWYAIGFPAGPASFVKTSTTWRVVQNLYNFLIQAYNPGGYDYGDYAYANYKDQMYTWANDQLSRGDLVFYDFQTNGSWDHVTVQTGYGTDPNHTFYSGSLVDAHCNNHYHEIWTLRPDLGAAYNTTEIGTVHIS